MDMKDRRGASDLLYRHWREGAPLEASPPHLRLTGRAGAYRGRAFRNGALAEESAGAKFVRPAPDDLR